MVNASKRCFANAARVAYLLVNSGAMPVEKRPPVLLSRCLMVILSPS